MKPQAVDSPAALALRYLQHIEALTEEIRVAMDAVGNNQISVFETSVLKQQEICTRLGRLAGQMSIEQVLGGQIGTAQGTPGHGPDRVLAGRLLQAAESLQALNQSYAALLRHSGESLRLFAGLCSSYTEVFDQVPPSRTERVPWSFES